MTLNNYYLFIGPDPKYKDDFHPGGQLTAAIGIEKFFKIKKLNLLFLNNLLKFLKFNLFKFFSKRLLIKIFMFFKYFKKKLVLLITIKKAYKVLF